MNPDIKIKRVFSSSIGLEKRRPKINIRFNYKKKSLNKILKDINTLKHEIFDNKSNNIFNYNFNNFYQKSKKESKRYNNMMINDFNLEDDYFLKKEEKTNRDNKRKDKLLKWNYSYFQNNYKKKYKINLSTKKQKIINLLNQKDPNIIEDWNKPKMLKILEKNSLIEEAIISKPWKFFPSNDNKLDNFYF